MAVLKLQQTRAPDFDSVSRILARAGQSFDQGITSAGSLLGSYQEGRQERVDNEVFAEISQLNSQEDLQDYFASGKLKGRQISQTMRERIGKLSSGIANVNQVRQSTAASKLSQGRQEAIRGENAAEELFRVSKRGEAIGNAQFDLAADRAARAGRALPGQGAAGVLSTAVGAPSPATQAGRNVSPEFAAVIPGIFQGESKGDYDALFGFSNQPGGKFENIKVTAMSVDELLEFQKPSGEYGQWVKSQNNGTVATPAGGFQVVGDTLRDAKKGLGLTGNEKMTPELQDKIGEYIFQTQGIGAWKGFVPGVRPGPAVAGEVDPLAALRGIGDPAGLGNQVGVQSPRDALAAAKSAGIGPLGGAPVSGDPIATAVSAPVQAASQFQTGAELIAKDASLRAARDEGEARRERDRAKVLSTQRAEATLAAIDDPNKNLTQDVVEALREIPGQTPDEELASISIATNRATDLQAQLNPEISHLVDPLVLPSVAAELGILDDSLQALPQTPLLARAKKFAVDPVQQLIAHLNIGPGGIDDQTPADFDPLTLDRMISSVAEGSNPPVSKAMAASAMVEIFRRDPSLYSGGFLFGFNTVENRFNRDAAIAFVDKNLSPDAMRRYDGHKLSIQKRTNEYKADVKALNNLHVTRLKQSRNGTDTAPIDAKIERLTSSLKRGEVSSDSSLATEVYNSLDRRTGLLDRFRRLNPNSSAYSMTRDLLLKEVHRDPNLKHTEKVLLIAEIKG